MFNVPPAVAQSPAVIQKADQPGVPTTASASPAAAAAAEQAKKSTGWKNVLKPANVNHAAKWGVETAISSTTGVNVKVPKVDYVGLYKWGVKKATPVGKRMSSAILPTAPNAMTPIVVGPGAPHHPISTHPAVGNQSAVLNPVAQPGNTPHPHPAAAAQPARRPAHNARPGRPSHPAAAHHNNASNSGYGNNSQYQDPNNSYAGNAQYQDQTSAYGGYQDPGSLAYGDSTNNNQAYGYDTQYQGNSNPAYGNNTQAQGYANGDSDQYQGNNNVGYGGNNVYYQDNSNSGGLDTSDVVLAGAMVAPDESTYMDPSTINYTDPSAPTYTDSNSPPLASPSSFWSDPTGGGTAMISPDPADVSDPYATSYDPNADATSPTASLADPYASMEMGVDPEAASMTGGSDQQSYTQTNTYEQTTTSYDDGNNTATYESTSDIEVDDTGYDSQT